MGSTDSVKELEIKMNDSPNPFSTIKGRYIIIFWLLPLFYLPGAETIFIHLGDSWPWYWIEIFYYYYGHLVFILALVILGAWGKLSWPSLFGNRATGKDLVPGLKLTAFILLFSIFAAYVLFLPLSYVFPRFVDWWFISAANIIYTDGLTYPIIANAFSFVSVVIIAPLVEEIAFRGLLIHRWSLKWGHVKAVLLSSFFFGIVHPDPIGATAFGIGMCILYMMTQSLLVPVICHAANNLFCWLIEAGYRLVQEPGYTYTLEQFQKEWPIGLIAGVIVILWAGAYLRNPTGIRELRLPAI